METHIESNTPKKIRAGKLCIAASIILILGVSSFFLCLLLDHYIQPYYRSLEDVFAFGILVSIVLVCFITPFLGIIACIDVFTDWRSVANPDDVLKNGKQIRKTALRFLISALLFVAVSLISNIIVIIGGRSNISLGLVIWRITMTLLGFVMVCISYKIYCKTHVKTLMRIGFIFTILLGLIALSVVFMTSSFGNYLIQRITYSKSTTTFSGSSCPLKQTSIVPTLDSPCPSNKNVIWCLSFQLAWNQMKDDVIGGPVQVVGAEELATRLNTAEQSSADMESKSFYAASGRIKEGIIGKIQQDMAAKFPSHTLPDFNDISYIPDAILAYSYLTANVPFEYPFRQVQNEFIFTGSNGIKTNVGAFGAWGYKQQYKKMREQVEILFYPQGFNGRNPDLQMKEFAVDLCRYSSPYQVVAAVVEPKDSLSETLDYIRNKTAEFKKNPRHEDAVLLDDMDVLMVPEMFWEIDHRFEELINRIVANANPAMPIIGARQGIKFRLDRYGAMLESEAMFGAAAIPRYFRFNRPFLVYMKKRGCEQPFFAMWVDNAELLNKKVKK